MSEAVDITALLARWREGDRNAENALMTAVYPLLRELAQMRLRRSGGDPTLSATELVNEAYARLARGDGVDYQNRAHFFAVAARAIRNFVVDYLRARGRTQVFSGLTTDEIAEAVGVSRATVVRNWRFAKAWLADQLQASR